MKRNGSESSWKIVDRGWYAVVDFRGERRRRAAEARNLHGTHPGAVRIVDEQGSIVHRNVYRPKDLREMAALWSIIGEWPGTEVHVAGHAVGVGAVEGFLDCYISKVISEGRPHPRCSDFDGHPSYIGCRDRHVAIDLRDTGGRDPFRPYWFEFAQARAPSDWYLDHSQMRLFLEALGPRRQCPALQETGRWIDRLPTQVEVPGSGIWRVVRGSQGPMLAPRDPDRYQAWMRAFLGEEPSLGGTSRGAVVDGFESSERSKGDK